MREQQAIKSRNTPIRRAMVALRQQVLFVLVFSAAVNLLYLAPSLYMMQVYDRVLTTGGVGTLLFVSLVLIVSLAVLALLDAVRTRILTRASLRADRLLSRTILESAFGTSGEGGPRSAQLMRDFDTVRQTATGPAAVAVLDAPWAPVYIAICFLIHWVLGLLVLFGGAALVCLALLNERSQRRALKDGGDRAAALFAAHEAERQGAEAARALGMRGRLVDRHLTARSDLLDVQSGAAFSGAGYASGTKFLRLVLQSAALGIGAYLAIQRQVSPGAIIAASILTARAFAPLEQIVGAWRQIGQAQASWKSLRALLESVPEAGARTPLPAPEGRIAAERVSVRAPGSERVVLFDVSARFGPTEIVGVVGPSGAGKSTFARVLAGAIAPTAGTVRIDNARYADWDAEALARHVGYLPQDVQLFSGTVTENISRFSDEADAGGKAVEAARQAGVHDMILRLPEGYDTRLGPQGRGLSFGQAQRIGLARALYGDPVLIVLDEPNAHLDAEGEAALVSALKSARARGATCVVVAHRAGIMSVADTIMVLRDGRLEALGPRDQVVAKLAPVPTPQQPGARNLGGASS